jgi:putative ABC transport system permease protein
LSDTATPVAQDGGAFARRAVIRWTWRLLRRQWRGQILVTALLTLAVVATVVGGAAAYNIAPAAGNAEFGLANSLLIFEEPDAASFELDIEHARVTLGEIEVIERWSENLPGLFEPVEFRAQDPDGLYSSPMLTVVRGRYPVGDAEVAVTDDVAAIYEVGLGEQLDRAGESLTVVGVIENPSDLTDEFALLSVDGQEAPESMTILTSSSDETVLAFRAPSGSTVTVAARPSGVDVLATVGVLGLSTVALALVGLLAATGFVAMAHRRLRQLGILAAIGATSKNLNLVMMANGLSVGVVAAAVGMTIGVLFWWLLVPALEITTAHRIDPFHLPWWLLLATVVLSVATATLAAWLPAREVVRTPIVQALSGRPHRPQRPARASLRAIPLLILGVTALVLAGDPTETWMSLFFIAIGIVAIILGVLAMSSPAIGLLARTAKRSRVSIRLAARDLARNGARSVGALAAISLALGAAVAIVLGTSAALFSSEAEGNLASSQLMVRVGEIPPIGDVRPIPDRSPGEIEDLDATIGQIAGVLGDARVTTIDVAIAPDFEGFGGLPAVVLTREIEPDLNRILTFLYVANESLLEAYAVDLSSLGDDVEFLTVEEGPLFLEPMRPELVERTFELSEKFTSLPGSFITPEALAIRDWDQARAAWLLEAPSPISEEQFEAALAIAATSGVTVESRADQANLRAMRTAASAAGIVIALGILAMTVGLLRSEAAGDLRTLTATGAPRSIRRSLTACTSGSLALMGSVLGAFGAYAGFIAGHSSDLEALTPVPIVYLGVILVGLPLLAAGAAWLLAGREPVSLARSLLD